MNIKGQDRTAAISSGAPTSPSAPASAWQSLSASFGDTLQLLFNPFSGWRWIKLSMVCLVLGGGTSSAAFEWSFGSLRYDPSLREFFHRTFLFLENHLWLAVLLVALTIGLSLLLLYLRAMCRFMLVDSLLREQVELTEAWRSAGPPGRSYFLWLTGFLVILGMMLSTVGILAFPFLRTFAGDFPPPLASWLVLAGVLLMVVLLGVLLTLAIVLTDDLVVPLMYAENLPLPAAWRKLWSFLRKEAAAVASYFLMRLAVSVGTGLAALFFLFPSLVGFFSASIIVTVLLVGTLRVVGVLWVWNAFTIALAALGLLVLTVLLLMLLSVVAMPALVLLQNFGIRFIGLRFPAVEAARASLHQNRRVTLP